MDTSSSLSQKAKTIALYLIEFYTETVERPSDRNHKTFIPSIFPIFMGGINKLGPALLVLADFIG